MRHRMAKLGRLAAVRRSRAFVRDERAGVLIEFGIIAPVLFALLLGIFDIALAYFTQVSIEHSASPVPSWPMTSATLIFGFGTKVSAAVRTAFCSRGV